MIKTVTLRRALITGIVLSVWLLGGFSVLKSLDLGIPQGSLRAITGLLGIVILFIGLFYGIKKKKENAGQSAFTYFDALIIGITISVIVAVIVSVCSGIYVSLINPGFASDMVKEAEQSLASSGKSAAEIAAELEKVRDGFSIGNQMLLPLIAQLAIGTVFSLAISFFLKSKKP